MTAAQKWDVSFFVLSTKRPCDWGDLAGVGVTAAQKWDVSVFVLSTERPCDWSVLAGVGVTAAPYPVAVVHPG